MARYRDMPLPHFTAEGTLPPGDYNLSLEELASSHLVTGQADGAPWDSAWRALLVRNLEVLVTHLWQVGIEEVFVDGSFVEDKPHPNDIDGYFVCDRDEFVSGRLQRRLAALDPVWTWDAHSRRPHRRGGKPQLPMWHKYQVELFPHVGQKVGIFDSFGYELTFPSAFRQTRSGQRKGILKIQGRAS